MPAAITAFGRLTSLASRGSRFEHFVRLMRRLREIAAGRWECASRLALPGERRAHRIRAQPRDAHDESGEVGRMTFVIKAHVADPRAITFAFTAQKTMYGGKTVGNGDVVFVFASENEGGRGLVARGVVTSMEAVPRRRGIARQTPRVSVVVRRTALAKRSLGRADLKPLTSWDDGQPATELNFKLYRQATNKIVGISDEAAVSLEAFF